MQTQLRCAGACHPGRRDRVTIERLDSFPSNSRWRQRFRAGRIERAFWFRSGCCGAEELELGAGIWGLFSEVTEKKNECNKRAESGSLCVTACYSVTPRGYVVLACSGLKRAPRCAERPLAVTDAEAVMLRYASRVSRPITSACLGLSVTT